MYGESILKGAGFCVDAALKVGHADLADLLSAGPAHPTNLILCVAAFARHVLTNDGRLHRFQNSTDAGGV
jgi:hypothetical protein